MALTVVTSQTADRRPIMLYVQQRKRGRRMVWHGRLMIDGREAIESEGFSRSRVLADLLDGLLAHGVDVEPCCREGAA